MDHYDTGKTQEIWQRVYANRTPTQPQYDTDALIVSAFSAQALYRKLARQATPRDAAAFKELAATKQTQAACLNGMRLLSVGQTLATPPLSCEGGSVSTILARCCVTEGRALREYELHTADHDHGAVWGILADEQRKICRTLLELLGRMG